MVDFIKCGLTDLSIFVNREADALAHRHESHSNENFESRSRSRQRRAELPASRVSRCVTRLHGLQNFMNIALLLSSWDRL